MKWTKLSNGTGGISLLWCAETTYLSYYSFYHPNWHSGSCWSSKCCRKICKRKNVQKSFDYLYITIYEAQKKNKYLRFWIQVLKSMANSKRMLINIFFSPYNKLGLLKTINHKLLLNKFNQVISLSKHPSYYKCSFIPRTKYARL